MVADAGCALRMYTLSLESSALDDLDGRRVNGSRLGLSKQRLKRRVTQLQGSLVGAMVSGCLLCTTPLLHPVSHPTHSPP